VFDTLISHPATLGSQIKMGRTIEGRGILMIKLIAGLTIAVFVCGTAFAPITAAAATDDNKAALRKATVECRAQVKEYARFNETSWYARHKMVKSCIKDALAKK